MTAQQPLSIAGDAERDAEAEVWVATSDEVPGLVVEHRDLSALRAMVVDLIPILLLENGVVGPGEPSRDLPISCVGARVDTFGARVAA